ncbi:uncharacterized protein DFL_004158 [Arthrobotrys flagrans]|uniref:Uncharacterized protein n=1 Tax=Arthrobotrys flagrans TaxID=97331 RepID=A0A437A3Z7_ARTFL|nr:hypothetical protein DFL_004158 [Arthrobotrys flagrans]
MLVEGGTIPRGAVRPGPEEVEDSDVLGVSAEESVGNSSHDQLWEGSNGVSEDGEVRRKGVLFLRRQIARGWKRSRLKLLWFRGRSASRAAEREKERLELERLEREFDEQMELAEKVEREDGEEADPPATEPQGSLGGMEGVRGGRAETGWQGRGTKWKEGTESTFRL